MKCTLVRSNYIGRNAILQSLVKISVFCYEHLGYMITHFLMKPCPIVFLTREDWIFPASCLELIYKLCPLNVWHLLRYVRPAVDTSPSVAVTAGRTTSSAAKAVIGHSNPVPDQTLWNEPIPSNDSSYNRAGLQRKHIIYASVTLQSQQWRFKRLSLISKLTISVHLGWSTAPEYFF